MNPQQIKNKLTQGDRVRFKDGFITYFEKPYIGDDTKGWFKEKSTSTSGVKYYKNIVKIGSKEINEITINKPGELIPGKYYYVDQFGRGNYEYCRFERHETEGWDCAVFYNDETYERFGIDWDKRFNQVKQNKPKEISNMSIKEQIKKEYKKILKEQQEETLTFEKDPIEYIIQRYPSLDATLIDLMTESYKDFLTGIYVMAPKPTTFKILLHNGQSFYLIYNPKAYIAKVAGKSYHLMSLKDEEYALKAISRLLLMGIPPSAVGPGEEQNGDLDPKDEFTSDMTSEPDLTAGLDNLDGEQPEEGEEGDLIDEPEEELQEQEEPKKKIKFRLIKEIKVKKPYPQIFLKFLEKNKENRSRYKIIRPNDLVNLDISCFSLSDYPNDPTDLGTYLIEKLPQENPIFLFDNTFPELEIILKELNIPYGYAYGGDWVFINHSYIYII